MAATGKTVPSIAKEHGYGKMAFYNAINGQPYSAKAQAIIANIIGKSVTELWPEQQTDKEAA